MALPRWPKQFYVFCLIPLVHAYTVFETNCSAPITKSNYVSSPNTRGTLDILWSSLFTIFACTWTLQHPNVPKQRNEDGPGRQGQVDIDQQSQTDIEQQSQTDTGRQGQDDPGQQDKIDLEGQNQVGPGRQGHVVPQKKGWAERRDTMRRAIKRGLGNFGGSTLRMLWTIFAPELIIAAACGDWVAASDHLKKMEKHFEKNEGDKVAWSLMHSHYANMGGFVIRLRGQPNGEVSAPLGPYKLEPIDTSTYHHPYHLTGDSILALRKKGHISKLPDISKAAIRDKSKSDVFAKLIALGQIVWSIIQIIVRAVRRLPVSPLEVAVAAYAVCAVIIYVVYLGKPQRVNVAHDMQLRSQETNQENYEENHQLNVQQTGIPPLEDEFLSYQILYCLEPHRSRRYFERIKGAPPAPMGAPISMDYIHPRRGWQAPLLAALFAAPFGGIHAAAWNFAFPSTVELMLWRWLSIYITAAPLCAWLFFRLESGLRFSFPGPLSIDHVTSGMLLRLRIYELISPFFMGIVYLFLFLYVLARLFILVEMFRTLCFLPSGSYISTWTTNMPHLA